MEHLRRAIIACVVLAGTGCDGGGPGACASLTVEQRGAAQLIPPAGVRVAFRVTDQRGEPVANLSPDEIEVINDARNRPFGSEGEDAPRVEVDESIAAFVMLVLDLSYSITRNPGRREAVVNGARQLVRQMISDEPNRALHPGVAIYAFGSTADSGLEIDFTSDAAALNSVLDTLLVDPGRGSTNLYGAFLAGLAGLEEADAAGASIVSRSLVIITDGVHETGNADALAAQSRSALDRATANGIETFAIPIDDPSAEYDVAVVCALDTGTAGCDEVDVARVGEEFERIAARLEARSRSNYVVGVCSPLESRDASLTIRITRGGLCGQLRVPYDATGFRLTNCETASVLDPCVGLECGEVFGVDCGACAGSALCIANRCCTPSCLGRTCGPDGCGGSCGECGELASCTPAGTCECDPQARLCDGACVDTTSDPDHCGLCGAACPGAANADPVCYSSSCGLACAPEHLDCDTVAGCETSTLLRAHDGFLDIGYGWPGMGTGVGEFVARFDLGPVPVQLSSVAARLYRNPPVLVDPQEIVVYAGDGPSGAPGTPLHAQPVPGIPADHCDPDPTAVALAPAPIVVGTAYVGLRWGLLAGAYLCADESSSTPLQEAYWRTNGGGWSRVADLTSHDGRYRALGIDVGLSCAP